jgi:hypothetical protein
VAAAMDQITIIACHAYHPIIDKLLPITPVPVQIATIKMHPS